MGLGVVGALQVSQDTDPDEADMVSSEGGPGHELGSSSNRGGGITAAGRALNGLEVDPARRAIAMGGIGSRSADLRRTRAWR